MGSDLSSQVLVRAGAGQLCHYPSVRIHMGYTGITTGSHLDLWRSITPETSTEAQNSAKDMRHTSPGIKETKLGDCRAGQVVWQPQHFRLP